MEIFPQLQTGRHYSELFDNWPEIKERLRRGLAGEAFSGVLKYNGKSYETQILPVTDCQVGLTGLNGIMLDVTARVAAEEHLRNHDKSFQAILDNSPLNIFIRDLQGRYLLANRYFRGEPHFKDREVVGYTNYDLMSLETARRIEATDRLVLEAGIPLTLEEELEFEGVERTYLSVKFPLLDEDGQPYAIGGIVNDITERKKMEEALRESQEQLNAILDNSPMPIFVKDLQGRYLMFNRRCEILNNCRREDVIGKTDFELFPRHLAETWHRHDLEVIRQGIPLEWDEEGWLEDGVHYNITTKFLLKDLNGQAYATVGIVTDITERKRAEQTLNQELLKNSKLESLGILAGGIAHDFNNILTAIIGNLSLARLYAQDGERKQKELLTTLQEVEKASFRAIDLTQQLLTFARGGAPVKKSARLPGIIRDSAEFALRGSRVQCELNLPADLWPVEVDSSQFSQVIQNLVINAMQAMPRGGLIELSAENISVTKAMNLPLADGKYIKITVRDQGVGIKAADLPRIFDPYFTTKQSGSGLGLATSFSIMKRHGGHIAVETTPGQGATFFLYLPAITAAPPVEVANSAPARATNPPAAPARILVMDDERSIRTLVSKILGRSGYEVEVAADGGEAVEKYRQFRNQGRPFDVLLMDLTVPGKLGGKEALELILQLDPAVKAIVSSGYSHDPVMANYQEYGFKGVVSKPYHLQELTQTIHAVLHEPGG